MPVVGSPEHLALCGSAAPPDGPVFALGGAEADADVRFAASGNGRLVSTRGEGLWRRAPWPVNDALFDLPPADDEGAVLVITRERDEVVERLEAHGATVAVVPELTTEALGAAAVVVLNGDGVLHPLAPCVLASRRVLIADGAGPMFGLQAGIEFLSAASPEQVVERANMARLHPRATASLRAMGARAAREHRASLVYPRLGADLAR